MNLYKPGSTMNKFYDGLSVKTIMSDYEVIRAVWRWIRSKNIDKSATRRKGNNRRALYYRVLTVHHERQLTALRVLAEQSSRLIVLHEERARSFKNLVDLLTRDDTTKKERSEARELLLKMRF